MFSTANKFEFLNLAYHLIDRLTALAHLTYPLRPGQVILASDWLTQHILISDWLFQSSDMDTDYRSAFVQSLEPIINNISHVSSGSGENNCLLLVDTRLF